MLEISDVRGFWEDKYGKDQKSLVCFEVFTKLFMQGLINLLDWAVSCISELFLAYFRFYGYAFGSSVSFDRWFAWD